MKYGLEGPTMLRAALYNIALVVATAWCRLVWAVVPPAVTLALRLIQYLPPAMAFRAYDLLIAALPADEPDEGTHTMHDCEARLYIAGKASGESLPCKLEFVTDRAGRRISARVDRQIMFNRIEDAGYASVVFFDTTTGDAVSEADVGDVTPSCSVVVTPR